MSYLNPKNWEFAHYATFFMAIILLPTNWWLLPSSYLCTIVVGTYFNNLKVGFRGE
jgi:hypothetical protein